MVDYSKHIQKAEEALRRRNHDFAIQLYQQLLEIDADMGDARAGLRQALRARYEAKKGGKFLRALKGATPLAMAKGLAKAGKHGAAAKALETYLATSPLDEEANLLLGMSLEAHEHYKSALAVYEFLAEIAPRNPDGLKRAGAMMAHAKDHARALEYYERALEADPRDRDALKARKDLAAEAALASSRSGEVQHSREQIKDKEEAQRLERTDRLHRSEDELREDQVRLEARLAEDSSNVEKMIDVAEVHERLRDPEAALDLLERALSYRKDSLDIQKRIGGLRIKALKKAISRADRASDQAQADKLEGELRGLELEELQRRIELHPGDAELRLSLGRAYLRHERHDDAVAELQKAVGDPRLKTDALFLLGQCFQKKGFNELAKKEFEKALSANPSVDERAREILYNLGAIAEAEGNTAEARSCYSRIYEVDIGFRDVASKMEQLR